jgi:Probable Zinc-ribbon domain/PilZ domain
MPKISEKYNLSVINPDLAKEWHPTRNRDLNPRTVTPGSGKKVWWICSSGHEWEATVYSRNRGSGCPVCSKFAPIDDQDALITYKELVKEWHLTRNSGLNLRHLPPGFKKKVWWLCQEGHEWQATVQSRIKGSDCPVCGKGVHRKRSLKTDTLTYHSGRNSELQDTNASAHLPGPNSASQEDDSARIPLTQLSEATGFRKNRRFLHRTTVILEDAKSGAWSYAQTKNFSNDGMLLESEIAFKPGTVINIKFDTQPFKTAPKNYRSVVKWCREVADETAIATFGIGVKFT